MPLQPTILALLSVLGPLPGQQVTQATSAGSEASPHAFSSVFTAHGQVTIEGYGPANKAKVVGCGADSWTDSKGNFVISGKVVAGDYLGCSASPRWLHWVASRKRALSTWLPLMMCNGSVQ